MARMREREGREVPGNEERRGWEVRSCLSRVVGRPDSVEM
jgi:hypothetical protein